MKVVIIGAGGFGREVLTLIKNINQVKKTFHVLGFIDDGIETGKNIHGLEVLGGLEMLSELELDGVVVAIADPRIRERVISKIPPLLQFPNVIHPNALLQDQDRISIGIGNIICAGCILTCDISIGNYCIINLSCTIGHDALLEDYSSIMPNVNISGGAHLKRGGFVGTGAKLIKSTILGSYCVVGAGAVVDKNVESLQTVVGVPARPIKHKND